MEHRDAVRKAITTAYCMEFCTYLEVFNLTGHSEAYGKGKWDRMQKDFGAWYCDLDSGNMKVYMDYVLRDKTVSGIKEEVENQKVEIKKYIKRQVNKLAADAFKNNGRVRKTIYPHTELRLKTYMATICQELTKLGFTTQYSVNHGCEDWDIFINV